MKLRDTLTSLKNAMVEIRAIEAENRAAMTALEPALAYMEKSQNESAQSAAAQARMSMSETFKHFEIIAKSGSCESQLEALAKLISEFEEHQGRARAVLDNFYHKALIVGLPESQRIARDLRDKLVQIETIRDVSNILLKPTFHRKIKIG
jgi:hypothetical protein